MNTPLAPAFYSMAKKAKRETGEQMIALRMDNALLAEIEEVGQRLRIRSKSERIRYLIGRGLEAQRGQFPQPQPHASGSK